MSTDLPFDKILGSKIMIDSIDIKNVRGFKKLALSNLKRINVIVGQNASGKTALLECIYLAGGGPGLSLKLKSWRGLGERIAISQDPVTLPELWADLFHKNSKTADISLKGSDDITHRIKICLEEPDTILVSENDSQIAKHKYIEPVAPITFQWFKGDRPISKKIRPTIEPNQLRFKGAPKSIKVAMFSSLSAISSVETAKWFSDLSKKRKVQPIIDIIKEMFPFIKNLEVGEHLGSSMVFADMPDLPEKIPLGLVSGGINKLLALLVAIPHQSVLIVDEIENGFFYEVLPKVWTALFSLSRRFGTQIIVSTHSWECLKYAADVLPPETEKDFCLLRASRNGQGYIEQFDGKSFKAVLNRGGELRKP